MARAGVGLLVLGGFGRFGGCVFERVCPGVAVVVVVVVVLVVVVVVVVGSSSSSSSSSSSGGGSGSSSTCSNSGGGSSSSSSSSSSSDEALGSRARGCSFRTLSLRPTKLFWSGRKAFWSGGKAGNAKLIRSLCASSPSPAAQTDANSFKHIAFCREWKRCLRTLIIPSPGTWAVRA